MAPQATGCVIIRGGRGADGVCYLQKDIMNKINKMCTKIVGAERAVSVNVKMGTARRARTVTKGYNE